MKISEYIKETRSEMSHVKWPSRSQAVNYALLVVAISVIIAAFLGLSDYIFSRLLTLFF